MLARDCFDAIGFKTSDPKEFVSFLKMACEEGFHPTSPRGLYAYWRVGIGTEVWIALDKQQKLLSYHPHFLGNSRVEVRLLSILDVAAELAGALHVQVNPHEEGASKFPLVFAVPSWDYTQDILEKKMDGATGPVTFPVQLTAFANDLRCYDTEEAYYASPTEQSKLSADHFIPTGLFVSEGVMPNPSASFAGRILQIYVVTNKATNQQTLYLSVQTLGMAIDVVADPTVIKGQPQVGGTVSGYFSLSGRMIEEIAMANDYCKLHS